MKRCFICTKTSVYYGEYMIKNARDQGPGRNNKGPIVHCSNVIFQLESVNLNGLFGALAAEDEPSPGGPLEALMN